MRALVIVLGSLFVACSESGLQKVETGPGIGTDGSSSSSVETVTPTTPAGTGSSVGEPLDPTRGPGVATGPGGGGTTGGEPAVDTGAAAEPEPAPEPEPEPEPAPEPSDTGGSAGAGAPSDPTNDGAVVEEVPSEPADELDGVEVEDTAEAAVPCDPAVTPADLDPLQTAGDGRVVYCHHGDEGLVQIETDGSSCAAHQAHGDVFPTTGCDS